MLKKVLLLAPVAMLLAFMVSVPSQASVIRVFVNNQEVIFRDHGPVIVDDRTLVPVREVFETLGFYVSWSEAEQQVIMHGDVHIIIPIGSNTFFVDGMRRQLDVPAQIINGRAMLPIRHLVESVGMIASWDPQLQIVFIENVEYYAARFERGIVDLINAERRSVGLGSLEWNGLLADTARWKSQSRTGQNDGRYVHWANSELTTYTLSRILPANNATPESAASTYFNWRLGQFENSTLIGVGYLPRSRQITIIVGTRYDFPFWVHESPYAGEFKRISALANPDPFYTLRLFAEGHSYVKIQDMLEQEVFRLTNIERANHGLPPLIWDDSLARASRAHSRDLAINNKGGHVGSDGSSPTNRANREGWQWGAGENVFRSPRTPAAAVKGWMDSPGHRGNILNTSYTHMGVGFYVVIDNDTLYMEWPTYTQKFGTQR